MRYDVKKEKGGRYYVYDLETSSAVAGTHKKDKKDVIKLAAGLEGMPYKEYLRSRRDPI